MKRIIKNIIMIVLLIGLCIGTYFTMNYANTSQNNPMQMDMGETPPSMGEGEKAGQTPPNGNGDMNENMQPPQMGENEGEVPEKPEGSMQDDRMEMKEMPSNKTSIFVYIVLGIESLMIAAIVMYLIISKFNLLSFKDSFHSLYRIIIYALTVVLVTGGLVFSEVYIMNHFMIKQDNMMPENQMNDTVVETSGAKEVESEETLSSSYTSSKVDESVILVQNGGNATITDATVMKESGDSSNIENSEFYGIKAGILVTKESSATITNATITTNAKGSNGVVSTGENSKIYIKDSSITTTAQSSARGLHATYGGYIEADNVTVTTQGDSCATLATDRGEGTVKATNSTLETNGIGSPLLYSTGTLIADSCKGTANSSQIVVVEGKNSATVTDSTFYASGTGNRGDVDQSGVMIYQSMSGDAGEGVGTFTAKNSTLSLLESSSYYKSAPMFFVTNTDAIINLNNNVFNYGSSILLSVKGTDEWGNSGANGGDVTFNAESQTLKGNIEIDNISTLSLNLTSSSYTGTINADNTAKEITIKLDKQSTITLTGDSYITSLDNEDSTNSNINFNGYKLYVNGKAI